MGELDDFLNDSAAEGTETAGDLFVINGQKVSVVIDEQSMEADLTRYGDNERVTASGVIAKSVLKDKLVQKTRIKRVSDETIYFIDSIDEDSAHYILMLYKEEKRAV
jgi:hypothetical protein